MKTITIIASTHGTGRTGFLGVMDGLQEYEQFDQRRNPVEPSLYTENNLISGSVSHISTWEDAGLPH